MGQAVQIGMGAWYNDWWWQARGTVSPDQKEAMIEAEAQATVKASGGRITLAEARIRSRQAITKQLIGDHADPSQSSVGSAVAYAVTGSTDPKAIYGPILKWLLIGGILIGGILLLKD